MEKIEGIEVGVQWDRMTMMMMIGVVPRKIVVVVVVVGGMVVVVVVGIKTFVVVVVVVVVLVVRSMMVVEISVGMKEQDPERCRMVVAARPVSGVPVAVLVLHLGAKTYHLVYRGRRTNCSCNCSSSLCIYDGGKRRVKQVVLDWSSVR